MGKPNNGFDLPLEKGRSLLKKSESVLGVNKGKREEAAREKEEQRKIKRQIDEEGCAEVSRRKREVELQEAKVWSIKVGRFGPPCVLVVLVFIIIPFIFIGITSISSLEKELNLLRAEYAQEGFFSHLFNDTQEKIWNLDEKIFLERIFITIFSVISLILLVFLPIKFIGSFKEDLKKEESTLKMLRENYKWFVGG